MGRCGCWVVQVVASSEESSGHWQQRDYKGFNNAVDWHNVDWNAAPAIQVRCVRYVEVARRSGG
jgi:hypothetical protein